MVRIMYSITFIWFWCQFIIVYQTRKIQQPLYYNTTGVKWGDSETPHKYDAAVYNDYLKQMKLCITIYTIRVMQMIDICSV